MENLNDKAKGSADTGGLGETVRVVIEALLIALVIRTFAFQPFNIPSGSLIPTLLIGDYLFVSKYTYGYSRHSFPFSLRFGDYEVPFPENRIWGSEPKRGDIAVFKLPRDGETDYIKRVIGLPGDRVQVIDGHLRINGTPVKKEQDGFMESRDAFGRMSRTPRFKETLPNGIVYTVIEREGNSSYWDNTSEYVVPAGHYFMMGDNRDNSTDSRDQSAGGVGFVPYQNLVGRAEIIFFSIEEGTPPWQIWKWPQEARWGRFFQKIR
ncbi:MAG: signal peptidase [Beijerinckiaceae bacterium]|nr:MAG: signal peptidase [Beijerinckiaceae bacterium]